ncbi:NAD-dependent protein deacylase [candidate division KSB1 bacterium]|nr:NAD-dependent protein deacylase [candidate division KSB1 bacterium]
MNELLIKNAADLIKNSQHAIVFTGAGISVESGIPPFRGENGLWTVYDPKFLDIFYFDTQPVKTWDILKELFYKHFENSKPNRAHKAIAELEKRSFVKAVITQNIDNFHQEAGSRNVIEFHGTYRRLICLRCKRRFSYREKILNTLPPRCKTCDGLLKPDFVFFSEPIPEDASKRSFQEAEIADLFLVIGTTGEIQPASSIPVLAKQNGAKIIEINVKESNFTNEIVDVFLQGKATEMMDKLLAYF